MDKFSVLQSLGELIRQGQLSKAELLEVYEHASHDDNAESAHRQSRISNILYVIGGLVVFLGICIFIGTNWGKLSDFTRILATLGSSVMLFVGGALLTRYDSFQKISDTFYFIANLTAPVGIFITMDIAKIETTSAGSHACVAGILLLINLLSFLLDRRNNVFMIFNVIFGTWFFFALTSFLIGGRPFTDWDYINYRWLAIGLSHMLMGYAFSDTSRKVLTPALYGFGVVELLTAALCLGGWKPDQKILWELLYPGICFGVLFLSVYLRSRSFLTFGTIYLMIYILKITNEYFTSGFGWALSLIFMGFALIGVGYGAFYLNQKYIRK